MSTPEFYPGVDGQAHPVDLTEYGVSAACPYRDGLETRLPNMPDYQLADNVRFLESFQARVAEDGKCKYVIDGRCSLARFAIEVGPDDF